MSKRNRLVPLLALAGALLIVHGVRPESSAASQVPEGPQSLQAEPTSAAEEGWFQRWLTGPIGLLLTPGELELARRLRSDAEFQAFQEWFWARRDPRPDTPRNELRDRFYERLSTVDREFGDPRAGLPGWSTTQGAIYMLLGPPDAVLASRTPVMTSDGMHDLQLWRYDDAPGVYGNFFVPFVQTAQGFSIAQDRVSMRGHRGLDRVLQRAVEATVQRPDLTFGYAAAAASLPAELPVVGSMRLGAEGLEGELSLPVDRLYGKAQADGRLLIELRMRFEGSTAGKELTLPPGRTEPNLAGTVAFFVDADELERLAGRRIRVAFWLPAEAFAAAEPARLVLIEQPSGREHAIAISAEPIGLPDRYAVEQVLCIAMLAGDQGLAVAFLEPERTTPTHPGGMWLTRGPGVIQGEAVPAPRVAGLQLVRLTTSARR